MTNKTKQIILKIIDSYQEMVSDYADFNNCVGFDEQERKDIETVIKELTSNKE